MARHSNNDRVFLGEQDISSSVTGYTFATGVDRPRTADVTMFVDSIESNDKGGTDLRLMGPARGWDRVTPKPAQSGGAVPYTSPCGCIWESKNAVDEGRYDKKIWSCMVGDTRGSRG